MARRAISRPGLPKMSPMNRMRMSVSRIGMRMLAAAAFRRCAAGRRAARRRRAWRRRGPRRTRPRRRIARAKRPNDRSAMWNAASACSHVAGSFWPAMTSVLRTNRTFTESGGPPRCPSSPRCPRRFRRRRAAACTPPPAAARPSSSRSNSGAGRRPCRAVRERCEPLASYSSKLARSRRRSCPAVSEKHRPLRRTQKVRINLDSIIYECL